jgi:hypothetical protein
MLKFVRKNQQIFIVFIILYCCFNVFTCYYLFSLKSYATPLFHLKVYANLGDLLPATHLFNFILTLCTVIGLLSVGFYLVRININYLIIQQRSQFLALFLISVSSFAFHEHLFSTAIVGSFFLLLAIDRVFSSFDKPAPSLRYLDAGILIAIGSLFYSNLIFFLPFFMISQFTLKQFNWKEFLYPLVGGVVPFIYIFSGYFLFNRPIIRDLNTTFHEMFFDKVKIGYSVPFLIGVGIYIVLMFIANYIAIRKYFTTKIQTRKLYQLIFYLFLNTVAIYIFIPSAGKELFYFISIPSSVLLSIYFSECRNNFINQVFFILLLLVPLIINIWIVLTPMGLK